MFQLFGHARLIISLATYQCYYNEVEKMSRGIVSLKGIVLTSLLYAERTYCLGQSIIAVDFLLLVECRCIFKFVIKVSNIVQGRETWTILKYSTYMSTQ